MKKLKTYNGDAQKKRSSRKPSTDGVALVHGVK